MSASPSDALRAGLRRALAAGSLALLAASCVSVPPPAPQVTWLAAAGETRAGAFSYRAALLDRSDPQVLVVVVEGDGAAWTRRGAPPRDPTPRRAIGAAIAERLGATAPVLYLGRPCQFLTDASDCPERYWTSARFAPDVVAAYRRAVDAAAQGRPVILVGFSGGGVLAAELALARGDTAGLITLASPLDLAAWTRHHDLSPLASPAGDRLVARLAAAPWPQLHVFGGADRIVPPAASAGVRQRLGDARTRLVPDADHDAPWAGLAESVVTTWIAGADRRAVSGGR